MLKMIFPTAISLWWKFWDSTYIFLPQIVFDCFYMAPVGAAKSICT